MRWLAPLTAALAIAATAPAATTANAPYSTRTEPGATGHTITTTVVPVRVGDETYACVISEDTSYVYGGRTIALAQSCDFGVSR